MITLCHYQTIGSHVIIYLSTLKGVSMSTKQPEISKPAQKAYVPESVIMEADDGENES